MDGQQLLRSPDITPTSEIISEALKSAAAAYTGLIDEFQRRDVEVEWRYYNDGKSWLGKGLYEQIGARGGKKEVTVFWLSIWDGFFKVTFYIPEKSRSEALNLPLSGEVKSMIAESKQIGKLKFFPLVFDLQGDELFNDICTLVNFRKILK